MQDPDIEKIFAKNETNRNKTSNTPKPKAAASGLLDKYRKQPQGNIKKRDQNKLQYSDASIPLLTAPALDLVEDFTPSPQEQEQNRRKRYFHNNDSSLMKRSRTPQPNQNNSSNNNNISVSSEFQLQKKAYKHSQLQSVAFGSVSSHHLLVCKECSDAHKQNDVNQRNRLNEKFAESRRKLMIDEANEFHAIWEEFCANVRQLQKKEKFLIGNENNHSSINNNTMMIVAVVPGNNNNNNINNDETQDISKYANILANHSRNFQMLNNNNNNNNKTSSFSSKKSVTSSASPYSKQNKTRIASHANLYKLYTSSPAKNNNNNNNKKKAIQIRNTNNNSQNNDDDDDDHNQQQDEDFYEEDQEQEAELLLQQEQEEQIQLLMLLEQIEEDLSLIQQREKYHRRRIQTESETEYDVCIAKMNIVFKLDSETQWNQTRIQQKQNKIDREREASVEKERIQLDQKHLRQLEFFENDQESRERLQIQVLEDSVFKSLQKAHVTNWNELSTQLANAKRVVALMTAQLKRILEDIQGTFREEQAGRERTIQANEKTMWEANFVIQEPIGRQRAKSMQLERERKQANARKALGDDEETSERQKILDDASNHFDKIQESAGKSYDKAKKAVERKQLKAKRLAWRTDVMERIANEKFFEADNAVWTKRKTDMFYQALNRDEIYRTEDEGRQNDVVVKFRKGLASLILRDWDKDQLLMAEQHERRQIEDHWFDEIVDEDAILNICVKMNQRERDEAEVSMSKSHHPNFNEHDVDGAASTNMNASNNENNHAFFIAKESIFVSSLPFLYQLSLLQSSLFIVEEATRNHLNLMVDSILPSDQQNQQQPPAAMTFASKKTMSSSSCCCCCATIFIMDPSSLENSLLLDSCVSTVSLLGNNKSYLAVSSSSSIQERKQKLISSNIIDDISKIQIAVTAPDAGDDEKEGVSEKNNSARSTKSGTSSAAGSSLAATRLQGARKRGMSSKKDILLKKKSEISDESASTTTTTTSQTKLENPSDILLEEGTQVKVQLLAPASMISSKTNNKLLFTCKLLSTYLPLASPVVRNIFGTGNSDDDDRNNTEYAFITPSSSSSSTLQNGGENNTIESPNNIADAMFLDQILGKLSVSLEWNPAIVSCMKNINNKNFNNTTETFDPTCVLIPFCVPVVVSFKRHHVVQQNQQRKDDDNNTIEQKIILINFMSGTSFSIINNHSSPAVSTETQVLSSMSNSALDQGTLTSQSLYTRYPLKNLNFSSAFSLAPFLRPKHFVKLSVKMSPPFAWLPAHNVFGEDYSSYNNNSSNNSHENVKSLLFGNESITIDFTAAGFCLSAAAATNSNNNSSNNNTSIAGTCISHSLIPVEIIPYVACIEKKTTSSTTATSPKISKSVSFYISSDLILLASGFVTSSQLQQLRDSSTAATTANSSSAAATTTKPTATVKILVPSAKNSSTDEQMKQNAITVLSRLLYIVRIEKFYDQHLNNNNNQFSKYRNLLVNPQSNMISADISGEYSLTSTNNNSQDIWNLSIPAGEYEKLKQSNDNNEEEFNFFPVPPMHPLHPVFSVLHLVASPATSGKSLIQYVAKRSVKSTMISSSNATQSQNLAKHAKSSHQQQLAISSKYFFNFMSTSSWRFCFLKSLAPGSVITNQNSISFVSSSDSLSSQQSFAEFVPPVINIRSQSGSTPSLHQQYSKFLPSSATRIFEQNVFFVESLHPITLGGWMNLSLKQHEAGTLVFDIVPSSSLMEEDLPSRVLHSFEMPNESRDEKIKMEKRFCDRFETEILPSSSSSGSASLKQGQQQLTTYGIFAMNGRNLLEDEFIVGRLDDSASSAKQKQHRIQIATIELESKCIQTKIVEIPNPQQHHSGHETSTTISVPLRMSEQNISIQFSKYFAVPIEWVSQILSSLIRVREEKPFRNDAAAATAASFPSAASPVATPPPTKANIAAALKIIPPSLAAFYKIPFNSSMVEFCGDVSLFPSSSSSSISSSISPTDTRSGSTAHILKNNVLSTCVKIQLLPPLLVLSGSAVQSWLEKGAPKVIPSLNTTSFIRDLPNVSSQARLSVKLVDEDIEEEDDLDISGGEKLEIPTHYRNSILKMTREKVAFAENNNNVGVPQFFSQSYRGKCSAWWQGRWKLPSSVEITSANQNLQEIVIFLNDSKSALQQQQQQGNNNNSTTSNNNNVMPTASKLPIKAKSSQKSNATSVATTTTSTSHLQLGSTGAALQVLLRSITFQHKGNNPQKLSKRVLISLSDGINAGVSSVVVEFKIVPVDDPTEVVLSTNRVLYMAGNSGLPSLSCCGIPLFPKIKLEDPDSDNFEGGFVSVTLSLLATVTSKNNNNNKDAVAMAKPTETELKADRISILPAIEQEMLVINRNNGKLAKSHLQLMLEWQNEIEINNSNNSSNKLGAAIMMTPNPTLFVGNNSNNTTTSGTNFNNNSNLSHVASFQNNKDFAASFGFFGNSNNNIQSLFLQPPSSPTNNNKGEKQQQDDNNEVDDAASSPQQPQPSFKEEIENPASPLHALRAASLASVASFRMQQSLKRSTRNNNNNASPVSAESPPVSTSSPNLAAAATNTLYCSPILGHLAFVTSQGNSSQNLPLLETDNFYRLFYGGSCIGRVTVLDSMDRLTAASPAAATNSSSTPSNPNNTAHYSLRVDFSSPETRFVSFEAVEHVLQCIYFGSEMPSSLKSQQTREARLTLSCGTATPSEAVVTVDIVPSLLRHLERTPIPYNGIDTDSAANVSPWILEPSPSNARKIFPDASNEKKVPLTFSGSAGNNNGCWCVVRLVPPHLNVAAGLGFAPFVAPCDSFGIHPDNNNNAKWKDNNSVLLWNAGKQQVATRDAAKEKFFMYDFDNNNNNRKNNSNGDAELVRFVQEFFQPMAVDLFGHHSNCVGFSITPATPPTVASFQSSLRSILSHLAFFVQNDSTTCSGLHRIQILAGTKDSESNFATNNRGDVIVSSQLVDLEIRSSCFATSPIPLVRAVWGGTTESSIYVISSSPTPTRRRIFSSTSSIFNQNQLFQLYAPTSANVMKKNPLWENKKAVPPGSRVRVCISPILLGSTKFIPPGEQKNEGEQITSFDNNNKQVSAHLVAPTMAAGCMSSIGSSILIGMKNVNQNIFVESHEKIVGALSFSFSPPNSKTEDSSRIGYIYGLTPLDLDVFVHSQQSQNNNNNNNNNDSTFFIPSITGNILIVFEKFATVRQLQTLIDSIVFVNLLQTAEEFEKRGTISVPVFGEIVIARNEESSTLTNNNNNPNAASISKQQQRTKGGAASATATTSSQQNKPDEVPVETFLNVIPQFVSALPKKNIILLPPLMDSNGFSSEGFECNLIEYVPENANTKAAAKKKSQPAGDQQSLQQENATTESEDASSNANANNQNSASSRNFSLHSCNSNIFAENPFFIQLMETHPVTVEIIIQNLPSEQNQAANNNINNKSGAKQKVSVNSVQSMLSMSRSESQISFADQSQNSVSEIDETHQTHNEIPNSPCRVEFFKMAPSKLSDIQKLLQLQVSTSTGGGNNNHNVGKGGGNSQLLPLLQVGFCVDVNSGANTSNSSASEAKLIREFTSKNSTENSVVKLAGLGIPVAEIKEEIITVSSASQQPQGRKLTIKFLPMSKKICGRVCSTLMKSVFVCTSVFSDLSSSSSSSSLAENGNNNHENATSFRHYTFDLKVQVSCPLHSLANSHENANDVIVVGGEPANPQHQTWTTKLSCNLG